MAEARRKFWGWGLESETLSEADAGRIARRVAPLTGLAFESADHPVDAWMSRALECMADPGAILNPGVLLPPRPF